MRVHAKTLPRGWIDCQRWAGAGLCHLVRESSHFDAVWPDSPATTWSAVTALVTLGAAVAAEVYAPNFGSCSIRSSGPWCVSFEQADRRLILKNIGCGPALNACLVDHEARLVGFVDVVQPLGSGTGPERKPTGRAFLWPDRELGTMPGFPYYLFYQDMDG